MNMRGVSLLIEVGSPIEKGKGSMVKYYKQK